MPSSAPLPLPSADQKNAETGCAELSEKMLSDTEALEKFANRELDTAKNFRKQLQKVSDAIHNALNKLGLDLGKSAAKDIKYAQETVDAWVDGMTTAISNAQKRKEQRRQQTETKVSYSLNDNARYDYSKSFAEQIDDFKAGKFAKEQVFILGGTPDIYQKIGLSALPMTMEQGHISDALRGTRDADHTMSEAFIKSIPELMTHPLAIIESDSIKDKSVVAIVKGEINGKQVVAPIQIGKTNAVNNVVIDSNHIATVFGKGNAVTKLLADAIKKEENGETAVYYWNKTEALPLLRVAGLQLPSRLNSDGLLHSIFDAGSPVNRKYLEQTETRQFLNCNIK